MMFLATNQMVCSEKEVCTVSYDFAVMLIYTACQQDDCC